MTPRLDPPIQLDYKFSSIIGVDVKGDRWSAIEVRGSAALRKKLGKDVGDETHVVLLRRLTSVPQGIDAALVFCKCGSCPQQTAWRRPQ